MNTRWNVKCILSLGGLKVSYDMEHNKKFLAVIWLLQRNYRIRLTVIKLNQLHWSTGIATTQLFCLNKTKSEKRKNEQEKKLRQTIILCKKHLRYRLICEGFFLACLILVNRFRMRFQLVHWTTLHSYIFSITWDEPHHKSKRPVY